MRRPSLAFAASFLAALALGASPAAADPPPDGPNALIFSVVCPSMAPFQVTVHGAVGFDQGSRVLTIRQFPDQGNLTLVQCTATNPILGTQTVFLQFVERG